MSQSVIFMSLVLLGPVEPTTTPCAFEQTAVPAPIPRYRRPPLPAAGAWFRPAPGEMPTPPAVGTRWHTANKVGEFGNPVIHPEVDTMEFRPTDALPGDARARVW